MPEIIVAGLKEHITFEKGKSLLDILLENKVFVNNPCNGKGVCGKCRVKITGENIPKPTETEQKLLKNEEIKAGIRLSCLVYPETDLCVELLQKERQHKVLTSGYIPEFEHKTGIEKKVVNIHRPTLEDQTPYEDQIKAQTGAETEFDALSRVEFIQGEATVVIQDNKVIAIEQGDTSSKLFGAAVDIGTTTVVCSLIDMYTGEEMSNASMINAQKHYGLDVLTRICYELEHPEDGIEKLQKAIVDSLNDMIEEACSKAGVLSENIYEISIAANCTMMHMLLGVDATAIGQAPFAPVFVRAKDIKASQIGLRVANGARLYCLPSVSAYIGADIVAGAYVCDLRAAKDNVLFIDIGTNGEIVLSNRGKLLSCSCAAGPALEGMNISSGMRAADGAIEDLTISEDGIQMQVIGDSEPIGICGSGILAAVKELLKSGIVKKTGVFIKLDRLEESDYRYKMIQLDGNKREFIITDKPKKLLITQEDIRQVQLAKGAILSGFMALLDKAGIDMKDLDRIMIAGQFGAHLPAESLTGTGILPKEIEDKLVYVGNTSKTGAYMALMSEKVKKDMEELANYIEYMELGNTDNYERLFSECLTFPSFK